MSQARGSALFSRKRKYPATTSDNRFNFSRNDDDFEKLAKGIQPKNNKVSNYWTMKLNSEWATAGREHIDESNLTEMNLI